MGQTRVVQDLGAGHNGDANNENTTTELRGGSIEIHNGMWTSPPGSALDQRDVPSAVGGCLHCRNSRVDASRNCCRTRSLTIRYILLGNSGRIGNWRSTQPSRRPAERHGLEGPRTRAT